MVSEIKDFDQIKKTGLGVDIDETLSWTVGHWNSEMMRLFGNPENLTVKELADKYGYSQNVPYWKTKEAEDWMEDKRNSSEFQKDLPLIENANHFLNKINKIIPIAAYITIRPESTLEGTRHWLRKHNFPEAPIVFRPNGILTQKGNKWKAEILEELFPRIVGIIDDNPEVAESLSKEYKGIVFSYNQTKTKSKLRVICCKDWPTVYREVKREFSK